MINKKRQELIIQNLCSISSEVRLKAIEQLAKVPVMPNEKKIEHLKAVTQDTDENVRALALKTIEELGGSSAPQPKPSLSPPLTSSPSSDLPSHSLDLPSMDSFSPQTPAAPKTPEKTDSFAALFDVPLTSPPLTQPLPPISNKPPEPELKQESELSLPPTRIPTPPTAPTAAPSLPPIMDLPINKDISTSREPKTSLTLSLQDLNKISNIPTLLEHIDFLKANKPEGHLNHLIKLANSHFEEVALASLQTIIASKDDTVAPEVLSLLANDKFSSQRRFLMLKIVMGYTKKLDAEKIKKIFLSEKDVIVKSGLIKVFAQNAGKEGLPTLIESLNDKDSRVRANAIEIISDLKIEGCESQIQQLLNDPENRVRVNAATFLIKFGYLKAFETLKAMMSSQEVWIKDSVIFALSEIGDHNSVVLLKSALKDTNQSIRLASLKALAKINTDIARKLLEAAAKDPDAVVAQVALSLTEKIKDTPLNTLRIITPREISNMQTANPTEPIPPIVDEPPNIANIKPATPPEPETAPLPSLDLGDLGIPKNIAEPQQATQTPQPINIPQSPHLPFDLPPLVASQKNTPVSIPDPIPPDLGTKPVKSHDKPAATPHDPSQPPQFVRERSMQVYNNLISQDPDKQNIAARDLAFIMGEDQLILLNVAAASANDKLRLAAAKIVSRRKTLEATELLNRLLNDPCEEVAATARKALS